MPYLNRTHRISAAWVHEVLLASGITMYRADSEPMAADIFTKPFPETKRAVWNANLQLINIFQSSDEIEYAPKASQSLRGDMKALQLQEVTPDPLEIEPQAEQLSVPAPPATSPGGSTRRQVSERFSVPRSWKGTKYVLIDFCASEDSSLCTPTKFTRHAHLVRCTRRTI